MVVDTVVRDDLEEFRLAQKRKEKPSSNPQFGQNDSHSSDEDMASEESQERGLRLSFDYIEELKVKPHPLSSKPSWIKDNIKEPSISEYSKMYRNA